MQARELKSIGAVVTSLAALVGCVEKGDTNVHASSGGTGGAAGAGWGGTAGSDGGVACELSATPPSGAHCFRSVQALDWNSGFFRLGDLDGDGDLDIVSALGPATALNQGGGTFSPPTSFGSVVVQHATLVDADGDGDPDLVGLPDGTSIVMYPNELGQLGGPKPLLTLPLFSSGPSDAGQQWQPGPSACRLVDVDGDGKLDLAVAEVQMTVGYVFAVLKGDGAGGFGTPVVVDSGLAQCDSDVLSADWNLDGKPDLYWCGRLFFNDGSGGFSVVQAPTMNAFTLSADMDGTSGADLVFLSGDLQVSLNDGKGAFGPPMKIPGGHVLSQFDVGDFTGDGYPDVVAQSGDGFYDRVWFAFGDGTGTVSAGGEYSVADGQAPRTIASGDFDGDSKADLVVATSTGKTKVLLTR